jgi:hypothetical protein
MTRPYWEVEAPEVINAGKQQFAYYKQSQILEISTIIEEDGIKKQIRRQALSGYKLQNNKELANMVLDFLEVAGVIEVQED